MMSTQPQETSGVDDNQQVTLPATANATIEPQVTEIDIDESIYDVHTSEIVDEKIPERTAKPANSMQLNNTLTQSSNAKDSTHLTPHHAVNATSQDFTEGRRSIVTTGARFLGATSKDDTPLVGTRGNGLQGNALTSAQRQDPVVSKAYHVEYRSEPPPLPSRTPSGTSTNSQRSQFQSPPNVTNSKPSHPKFADTSQQYGQPFGGVLQQYRPTKLEHQHQAAEIAAAASIAAQQDARYLLHNSDMLRNQIPANLAEISNHIGPGNESKAKQVAMRNHPMPSNASSVNSSRGYPHTAAKPFTVGQHHAAASAAEQHLQWRGVVAQSNNEGRNLHPSHPPEVIEIDDDGDQKDELIKHFTAAIIRQLGAPEASSGMPHDPAAEPFQRSQDYYNWQNRKRSLPDAINNERAAAIKRQSLSMQNAAPTYVDRPFPATRTGNAQEGSLPPNRVNHVARAPPPQPPPQPNSTIRVVNVSDAMNIALDVAISSDTSQNGQLFGSSGRRVDTPMTYLVRQLLGQVEILGDEPAVVLAPALVKDASNKIRLVINKLIEMIVVKAKKDSQMKIGEAESRMDAIRRSQQSNGREKTVEEANQQKRFMALKNFAEEKCQQLVERDRLIEHMRTKIDAHEAEIENSIIRRSDDTKSKERYEEKSNATMRQLIGRLDEGMSTIQRQQKEIKVLKAFIEKDKSSLQKKNEMSDETMNSSPNYEAARIQEIASLKAELTGLRATLDSERKQHENTLKAYMRAAVHALKIQNGEDESPM